MNTRNDAIKALRPIVETEAIADQNHEKFQNEILRPILKLQDEVLTLFFKNYIEKRKGAYHKLGNEQKLDYINHAIRKDLKFKHLLLGLAIGLFQEAELIFYLQEEKELSKRLTNLIVQRLQSHLHDF